MALQRTLKSSIRFSGIGLHTGALVEVEVRPASANTGIVFCREDLPNKPYIKASPTNVFDTTLATRIGTPQEFVSTIEHMMAAFFGFGIDNAVVSLNSFELPIVDGSAVPFLVLFDEAGVEELEAERKVLVIKKPIEVVDPKNPTRFIRIEPSKKPWITYAIDFDEADSIGKQHLSIEMSGRIVCEEISFARTFCLAEDVTNLQARGLARGGSLENAIVVSRKDGVLNTKGLRSDTEFVRHKVLDCIGDLALLGAPVLGHVVANRAGHDLHTALAKKILASLETSDVVWAQGRSLASTQGLFSFPKSLDELEVPAASVLVVG